MIRQDKTGFTQHHFFKIFNKSGAGFSFISLLISIAILAVLAVSAFLWIDPIARFNTAEDTRRTHDVGIIAAALADYMQNNQGKLPFSSIVSTSTKKVLCSTAGTLNCAGTASSCIPILDTDFYDDYLAQLPVDPDKTSTIDTGYYLLYSSTTRQLEVGSCAYNNDPVIMEPQIFINSSVYYEAPPEVPDCSGYDFGGYCWYYGGSNQSCNTACTTHGGCVAEDWNDNASCSMANHFVACEICSGAAQATAPRSTKPVSAACVYRLEGTSQNCATSGGPGKQRFCACTN